VITLHGTDVQHPVTRALTRVLLGRMNLVATVSSELARLLPRRTLDSRFAVLPCGVDLERFRPLPRAQARARLGLDPGEPVLLFPADRGRAVKRYDRAREAAGDVRLLTAGAVAPTEMPWWINAANAVVVPSDTEGFGLSVLEALACDVPVLATPVGVHPIALDGLPGTLCASYDRDRWRAALGPLVADADPRIPGRPRAALFSSDRMAARVLVAWRAVA
jgi:glycosyltransferase involved in cell wall biosynthesis